VAMVLVHGGGFGGACWERLAPLLGEPPVVVDLPGRGGRPADLASVGIGDFVDAVAGEIIGRDLTDVTLVGHSLAGVTLPGVAGRVGDRLRRVVFVSCVVPAHGQRVVDVLDTLSPAVQAVIEAGGAADAGAEAPRAGILPRPLAEAMFCNDMDDEQRAYTLSLLVPEALGVIHEPVDLSGLRVPVPRTYVRLLQDASIVPAVQDRMIERLGQAGGVGVVDLDAGHMAMISRPSELAAVLEGL
jgi:pimeloyl-ACP methyl ester carboxylesterase